MAASQASIAASKLLNPRNTAVQILLHRLLLHPSAAASIQHTSPIPTQPLNLFLLENATTDSSGNTLTAGNQNFLVSNHPLNFQLPIGSTLMQIEAARGFKPSTHKDDGDDELEDDDDGFDDFENEDDDADIEDLSGLEFDDDEDDEDPDIRRPNRK